MVSGSFIKYPQGPSKNQKKNETKIDSLTAFIKEIMNDIRMLENERFEINTYTYLI